MTDATSWMSNPGGFVSISNYESSDWQCELFGMGPSGIVFNPRKGQEPNAFWRLMQYLVFGNKWVRKV